MPDLAHCFEELIRRASTTLPGDVESALRQAADAEGETPAGATLRQMLDNATQASEASTPICQDTGTPVVWIHHPVGGSTRALAAQFREAVQQDDGLAGPFPSGFRLV